MNWLFYERETNTKARVSLIYNVEPPEKFLADNNFILVTDVPQPENQVGKIPVLYCNPETNELWYEYFDRSLTTEEILNQKIQEQEQAIAELTLILSALQGGAE